MLYLEQVLLAMEDKEFWLSLETKTEVKAAVFDKDEDEPEDEEEDPKDYEEIVEDEEEGDFTELDSENPFPNETIYDYFRRTAQKQKVGDETDNF